MKVAILGAGAFGTALGGILAEKGYDVDYYDPKTGHETLSRVVDDADKIVLAAPSKSVPFILPYLPTSTPLIIATKGIMNLDLFDGFRDYMILSGPAFADDIKNRRNVKLTATDRRIIEMFSTDYLTFDYTDDERGVLLCGALKNVYALLCGYLNLKPGMNNYLKFLHKALDEMGEVLQKNGADKETAKLACGRGDLKITCNVPSRNYEYGQLLRSNPLLAPDKTVEGLTALRRIKRGEIVIPETAILLKEIIKRSDEWS